MPLIWTKENGRTICTFFSGFASGRGLGEGVDYFKDDKMICPKME